jgi:sec-independent protein translocase protein TatA
MLSDLGWEKIVIILLVLFIFFGAKKLPEMAQGLGKGIKEFKKALKDDDKEDDKSVKTDSKDTEKK